MAGGRLLSRLELSDCLSAMPSKAVPDRSSCCCARIFRIDQPTHTVRCASIQTLARHPAVAWMLPLSLGDSHRGFAVLGTTATDLEHFRFGQRQPPVLAQGDGAMTESDPADKPFTPGRVFAGARLRRQRLPDRRQLGRALQGRSAPARLALPGVARRVTADAPGC